MNYKKILVPHDGSEMADVALKHAAGFAKAYGSEIIILSVVRSIILPSFAFMSSSEREKVKKAVKESMLALKKESNMMLDSKVDGLSKNGIKASKVLAVENDPASEIIRVAKNRKVDLIIMGSRARKGMAKLGALGSVARKVSEQVHCPVLIVK